MMGMHFILILRLAQRTEPGMLLMLKALMTANDMALAAASFGFMTFMKPAYEAPTARAKGVGTNVRRFDVASPIHLECRARAIGVDASDILSRALDRK
jgi:hypothetical protein